MADVSSPTSASSTAAARADCRQRARPGQPHPRGRPLGRADVERRRDRDRRRRRDVDARYVRGPHALLVERRGDPVGDPDDAARGARAVVRKGREEVPRGRLHLVRRRRLRKAAPRRRHSQRDQLRPDPRAALSGGEPGDHGARRTRRRDAAAPAVSGIQLRRQRQFGRRDAQGRAHVPEVRRRHDQAQPVGRQLHARLAGRHDLDERWRGRRRDGRGACAPGSAAPRTRARPRRSSRRCATAST